MGSRYLQINNRHLFIWLAIMFILSFAGQTMREEENDEGQVVQRCSPLFAVFVFLPVFLMAVLGAPQSDTHLYLSSFHELPYNLGDGWQHAIASSNPGFTLLGVIVKALFGPGNKPYRIAIGLIHSLPIILIYRRYSEDYLFTIYLFVASSMHLAWMMNGLRQFIAVTIIFCATPWIVKKNFFRVIAVILLASTFHKTALFMIPVVFIVQGEVWNWKTIMVSILTIIAALYFLRNVSAFEEFASSVGYSTSAAMSMGDDGAHPLRVLVSAVPTVLSFLSRDELRQENSRIINICVNMSVITTGVYLVAMVTSGIMTGRMPIYTELYNLILLPHVIDVYFEGNNATLVKILAIIMYFLYFYVQRGF